MAESADTSRSAPAILLVDDDTDVLDTIGSLLRRRGFDVTAEASGQKALTRIDAGPFDLVITDCRMSPVDGWGVLKAVKEKYPLTPVIILTGFGDIETAVTALRRKAADFLVKPVTPESLYARVEVCLAQKALALRCQSAESSLEMTNRAIEALLVGLVICKAEPPSYPIVFVNKGFEALTGYSAGEVLGRNMSFLRGELTDLAAVAAIRRALKAKEMYSGDILNYCRDGTPFWNHLTVSPVFDDRGEATMFVSTIMDVSPRKHLEFRLRESESRFRQLSENMDEVFWLVDKGLSQTLYISPSYEEMWHHPCAELQRHAESRLGRIVSNDRLKVISHTQPPPEKAYEVTYRLEPVNGITKWVRERGFPVKDDDGNIIRLAIVFSDITEEKRLQTEMEQHMQQVVHADRLAAIGEVVAGVAHEINNPNSFITYNTPLLEETWQIFRPALEAYHREHPSATLHSLSFDELMADMADIIDAIKIGSARINRIVNNLKDFARLDENTHFQPVNINSVVEHAMTIAGAQVRKSADLVKIDLADDMFSIKGHPQKLEQVLVNLLINAAHAIPDKKNGRVSVRTKVVRPLGAVMVEVEDNGVGIPGEHMDRLFDPFFTTRRAGGGTGLGLSVSYGLVKEHGGMIGVQSRTGAGSRFMVFLPADGAEALDLNPTILCVDDQPAVLRLIRAMLITTEDRFVKTVGNPADVIPFLSAHPEVDIVISDIKMPKIDGWQILRMIREQFPLVRVILFSAHADLIEDNPDGSIVADATIAKPFERAELIQAIQSVGRMKL